MQTVWTQIRLFHMEQSKLLAIETSEMQQQTDVAVNDNIRVNKKHHMNPKKSKYLHAG